jgi:hypothetical protein
MTDSFWTELLDLCRKHGVTELYSTNPGKPGRITLTYDEYAKQGEFILSDIGVRTSKPGLVPLKGTQCLYVYADNVKIDVVSVPPTPLEEVRGKISEWISRFSKRTGRS